jgi:hypothetical protein
MVVDKNAQAVPVWNVETLRAHITTLMDQFDKRMAERHDAAERAIKIAFDAQNTAMQAAFAAQREAVTTAFLSQKEAVNAALAAADRAVLKAELSTDKRFESVNEFRGTLADQQRMLMPRLEAETISKALEAKLDSITDVLTDKIEQIQKTILASANVRAGVGVGWQLAVAVVVLVLALIGTAIAFYHK